MTATRRGPVIDARSEPAPAKTEWDDGHVWPRGTPRPAPECDEDQLVDAETGWRAGHWGPMFGRAGRTAWGGWRWSREDAPEERDEGEVESWLWSACRAAGCVLLGAALAGWRAASWVIDVPGIRSEHRLHREVHRAAHRCEQGIGTVEHLHAAIRHHRDYRDLHIRRAWFRRAKAIALLGALGYGSWWLPRQLGALAWIALLGAVALGAVWGAHRIGAHWLAERADRDEWGGDDATLPPPVDVPSAHQEQPRPGRPPTDTVLLLGVRGAFVAGDAMLPTAEIVARCRNGGGWWGQVTTREMGMRLASLGLKSVSTNMAGAHGVNPKGFRLGDIISALAVRTPDGHDE